MKKLLLFVAAAAIAVSASAQLNNRQAVAKKQAQQKALPAASFKKYQKAGVKKNATQLTRFNNRLVEKQFNPVEKMMTSKFSIKNATAVNKFKAGQFATYYDAYGKEYNVDTISHWKMVPYSYTDSLNNTTNYLINVVPDVISGEGLAVEYYMSGDTVKVQPQLVAINEAKGYYFFLFDGASDDYCINFILAEDGTIKLSSSESQLFLGVFKSPVFDDTFSKTNYLGYWTYFTSVKYYKEGQAPEAPKVSFMPNSLVLYAGLGLSGYSYNNNLVMMGAYGPVNFYNTTSDAATAWDWSVEKLATSDAEDNEVIRGNEMDFVLNTVPGGYTNLALVGENAGAKSDSCIWGVGQSMSDDGVTPRYTALYAYAGDTGSSFEFSDGSLATMTAQNPDGDLTFYTNWGTPDIYTKMSISKLYIYEGEPTTPFFFTGVTLPLVNFKDNGNFNLQVKIRACSRDNNGKITLGDVIAESNATAADIDDTYATTSGLTAVNFTKFFTTDEFGMTTELSHLFIDEEFLIEIDGWDNGTFSGIVGCQDVTNESDLNTTWFELTGEEGSTYAYTSWKTSLFVGLIDAAYGYLKTDDATEHKFANEGGEYTMHIHPMLYSSQEGELTTRLFTDDEIPAWLNLQCTNPTSNDSIDFNLQITAEALPAGETGRYAKLTLYQEGGKLDLLLIQGDGGDLYKTPVEITKEGYATFYSYEKAHIVPQGLKAYVVSDVNDKGLVYTEVGDTIFADLPVVLASVDKKAGSYKLVQDTTTTVYNGDNLLVDNFLGYLYCMFYGEENFYFYKLTYSNDGKKFGWYWGAPKGGFFEVDDDKAMLMLEVETADEARGFTIDGAAVTGIEEIATKSSNNNAIYNLQGVRVAKAKKGLYITGNKKIVIK